MSRGIVVPHELQAVPADPRSGTPALPAVPDATIRQKARKQLDDRSDEIDAIDQGGVLSDATDAAACHEIGLQHSKASQFGESDLAAACAEYARDDREGNWAVLQLLDGRDGRQQSESSREGWLRAKRASNVSGLREE